MLDPVGVVCRLRNGDVFQDYTITARVLCDRVKHALRREVKARKTDEIKETIEILGKFRGTMQASDFADLRKDVMGRLAEQMVQAGRASEQEAFDALQTQRGCAIAMHHGVAGAPDLDACLAIMDDTDNFLAFIRALGNVMAEQEEALGNSTSPTAESRAQGEVAERPEVQQLSAS